MLSKAGFLWYNFFMSFNEKINISDSASTKIFSPETLGEFGVILNNNDSGDIYVGQEDVSKDKYFQKIEPQFTSSFDFPLDRDVYVIGSNSSMTAGVFVKS